MTTPNTPPSTDIDAQVAALMAVTGLDEETVRKLLTAQDQQAGESIGTIRQDLVSGAVAHRVKDGGITKWRVSHPTDGVFYEMTPTKASWTLISAPAEGDENA